MTRRLAFLVIASVAAFGTITIAGYTITPRLSSLSSAAVAQALMQFPEGTATPSEASGGCHQAIYKEFSDGSGGDMRWPKMQNYSSSEPGLR